MIASKSKTCCLLAKKVSKLFCTCAATPPDPRGQRSLSSRYITGFVGNYARSLQIYTGLTILGTIRLRGLQRGPLTPYQVPGGRAGAEYCICITGRSCDRRECSKKTVSLRFYLSRDLYCLCVCPCVNCSLTSSPSFLLEGGREERCRRCFSLW